MSAEGSARVASGACQEMGPAGDCFLLGVPGSFGVPGLETSSPARSALSCHPPAGRLRPRARSVSVAGVRDAPFAIRAMTASDANAVAAWHYPGVYSFYDWEQDAEDLAELLDPEEWGRRYFAVDRDGDLVGFFVFKLADGLAEVGLGLRPDLTGLGLGDAFLDAGLRFAADELSAEGYTLAVAAFNRRAITVYERAGFAETERYEHHTNGCAHAFVRMTR